MVGVSTAATGPLAEPPAARRRAEKNRTRERILDAAVVAFAEQGYEGTSLATVAQSVGLSQPGVLHHFRSKRGLLMAVLERRDQIDRVRFGMDSVDGPDVLDHLADLMAHNATVPGLVQSFSVLTGESAAENHTAHDHFTRRYAELRSHFAKMLTGAQERGEIRPEADCAAAATEIIAMMDGLQLQWLHDPQEVDMVTVFSHFLDRLRADPNET
jgi:AcrR family transcriptional regulator